MPIELITSNGKKVTKMSKQPLSTQLLAEQTTNAGLSATIDELKKKITELETSIKNKENSINGYYKQNEQLKADAEQLPQLLDALPNAVARESKGEEIMAKS